jgi:hypothetical protein
MENRLILMSLAIGIAGSLIASIIQLSLMQSSVTVALTLAGALLLVCVFMALLIVKFREIKSLGIRRWEKSISEGTTTLDWIKTSQKSLLFLGVASGKWIKEEAELRRMLVRYANNGGNGKFLLLDPKSDACRNFETMKNAVQGTLSEQIIEATSVLLKYADNGFPVEVRYYDTSPTFRLVICDGHLMALALYSYMSDSGDDSPQIILDGDPRPWSFYYGFSAYADRLWQSAKPARRIVKSPEKR